MIILPNNYLSDTEMGIFTILLITETGNTMNSRYIIFILFFIAAGVLNSQTVYNWPCDPFNQQHYINGTFCENRPSGDIARHHFHDGIDIHLPQGSNVYSVINGSITSFSTISFF